MEIKPIRYEIRNKVIMFSIALYNKFRKDVHYKIKNDWSVADKCVLIQNEIINAIRERWK